MILNKFPSTEEFYKTYWGKKPFVVRGAIESNLFNDLIDGDTLAGLSLEEDIKSRLVITAPEGNKWKCEHGPFDENRFASLGQKNWSLLVQNVEQYHTDTAKLLQAFNFAPRWLMDDIMVSYSVVGGSVGPHTDSYHVFLVQGAGKRQWKIGNAPIQEAEYIENTDLKILKNDFDGEKIEVSIGDVIYLPPHFVHEGITTEDAITFSVGFLGPQLSEMLVEYGHYLEQNSQNNKRYSGHGLDSRSAGFTIASTAQKSVQNDLAKAVQSDDFSLWMAQYFSTPTHAEIEDIEVQETPLSSADLLSFLQAGQSLHRQEYIKISMTISAMGAINLTVYGTAVATLPAHKKFLQWLNQNTVLSLQDIETLGGTDALMNIVTYLYNQNVFSFSDGK